MREELRSLYRSSALAGIRRHADIGPAKSIASGFLNQPAAAAAGRTSRLGIGSGSWETWWLLNRLDGQQVLGQWTDASERFRKHARRQVFPRFGAAADIGTLYGASRLARAIRCMSMPN